MFNPPNDIFSNWNKTCYIRPILEPTEDEYGNQLKQYGESTKYKFNYQPVTNKKEVEVKVPQEYEASVFMVGDALIHSCVYQDARTGNGYDFKPQIEHIKPISSKYDLVYYYVKDDIIYKQSKR